MVIPKFVLGHNALIGVHHSDKGRDMVKPGLSNEDLNFLRFAIESGVEAIVLDNHPAAIETAKLLTEESDIRILPMIPYAQAVVDEASSSGLSGVVREMAASVGILQKSIIRTMAKPGSIGLTQIGAHLATNKYLSDYPKSSLGKVCFLHNVVTDLMVGWGSELGLLSFSRAIRSCGMIPGFVTLNPLIIPEIVKVVGDDSWFMTSVNSEGIQMGPEREEVENMVLSNPRFNILAMSILGGGMLDPEVEIPRAFSFDAVKSIVVGTTSQTNLSHLLQIVG